MAQRTLYELVKQLLEVKPALRDSDKKLTWSVWIKLGFADNHNLYLDRYLQGNCPSSDTITRAARKVKELHPQLKGSPAVVAMKQQKQASKGTFIFRDGYAYYDN